MTKEPEYAAFIGIDWADTEHAVCLLTPDGPPEQCVIAQKAQELAAWALGLRDRFAGKRLAVCLEQSRGALIYALMQYDFLVLFPINPSQLAAYRKALNPSGAKDDPKDAQLLASFLREHGDRLRAWKPDDETTRGLRLLTEQRRRWVEDRVAYCNELQQRLKESYVLALQFAGNELHGVKFLALLEQFPSQRDLQRASPQQLAKWLPRRRRVPDDPPAEELLQARIAEIRNAPLLAKDAAVLEVSRLAVMHLVLMLRLLNQSIADCEKKIAALLEKHPDTEIFASFPGAGPALMPRLIAAFGTDRKKFGSAQDLQRLSGIAPVTKRSGKTCYVQMRWACPTFLRQTFHEFARCSQRKCRWAKAYVTMLQSRGYGYNQAIRSLAFKWLRILFRCWQTRTRYDDDRYLQKLTEKGAALLNHLPQNSTEAP
jgi:transposase